MNVETYFETCWILDDKNKATLVIDWDVVYQSLGLSVKSITAINRYEEKNKVW